MGKIWNWIARFADIRTLFPGLGVAALMSIGTSVWAHVRHLPDVTIFIYGYAAFIFSIGVAEYIRRYTFRRPSFRLIRYGEEVLLGVHISSERKSEERKVTIDTHPHCLTCETEMGGDDIPGSEPMHILYVCPKLDCLGRKNCLTISKAHLKYCRESQKKITEAELHRRR